MCNCNTNNANIVHAYENDLCTDIVKSNYYKKSRILNLYVYKIAKTLTEGMFKLDPFKKSWVIKSVIGSGCGQAH